MLTSNERITRSVFSNFLWNKLVHYTISSPECLTVSWETILNQFEEVLFQGIQERGLQLVKSFLCILNFHWDSSEKRKWYLYDCKFCNKNNFMLFTVVLVTIIFNTFKVSACIQIFQQFVKSQNYANKTNLLMQFWLQQWQRTTIVVNNIFHCNHLDRSQSSYNGWGPKPVGNQTKVG